MGFGGDRRDQASLGDAGHRMLSHHVNRGGGGRYDAVPPPLRGAPMMAQQVSLLNHEITVFEEFTIKIDISTDLKFLYHLKFKPFATGKTFRRRSRGLQSRQRKLQRK